MKLDFINLMQLRRSNYDLNKDISVTDAELLEMIKSVAVNTPTAFNSQSSKIIVLTNEEHEKLWLDITLHILKELTSADAFVNTTKKMESFANGYGTILFFDDEEITTKLENTYPLYKDNFKVWANHSSAMMQLAIWLMFTENNIGASLQHYNPIIDEAVKEIYGIEPSWRLIAQMPFGGINTKANPKEKVSGEELVIKKQFN